MAYIQLVFGLALLVVAGDGLVRGSVSLAKRLGVPTLLIGLTIVAFGTSAPELVVGVDAVLAGAPTLALGNIVGSNVANILLVLGLPAIIAPIACNAPKLGRNMTFMIGVSILFIAIAAWGPIGFAQGAFLTALLIGYLYFSATRAKSPIEISEAAHALEELDGLDKTPDSALKSGLFVVGGLIGLAVGADLLVDGAVTLARTLGVSEAVIGLTIVAIGTSLPELVTGVAAAMHKHGDVAVGNVIGSNLFNILGIGGISAMVGTIPVPENFLKLDLWIMLACAVILVPFYLFKRPIGRLSGIFMLVIYGGYMTYLGQFGA